MSKNLRNNLLKYGITAMIGGLMACFTINSYGYGEASAGAERLRILSDAFTIPGVILIMCGFLVMVANGGFFNGISYAAGYAVRMLIPGASKDMGKYGDYVEQRSKRKKLSCGFLFVVGAVFLVISIVFIILYYHS